MWEWLVDLLDFGALVSVPEMLLRVMLACICGGIIGAERNRRQKDAGTRTHLVVGLGAALFMLVSKYGFFDIIGTGMNADATRIASTLLRECPSSAQVLSLQKAPRLRDLLHLRVYGRLPQSAVRWVRACILSALP